MAYAANPKNRRIKHTQICQFGTSHIIWLIQVFIYTEHGYHMNAHTHTHTDTHSHLNLNWVKPVRLCLQSSFVVRQNGWADVVAVVITLGLTGSRWLSSYKLRVKAEGKQTSEQQENVSPQCCHRKKQKEREGESVVGKSQLSQCKVNKPTHWESESASETCKGGEQSRPESSVE